MDTLVMGGKSKANGVKTTVSDSLYWSDSRPY
jgi:hypothetical protein